MKKIIGKTLLVLISVLFLFSLSYAGENKKPPTAIQTDKIPSTSAVQVPKCPDLEVKSALIKTKSGTNGIVTLDEQICNVGTADYVPPILAPAYAIWQVYDPGMPPADGNYRIIGRGAVNHLAKSACTRYVISDSYSIPRLIEWGHGTPKPGTCQSELVFLLSIKKNSTDDVNFSRNEDCNTTNNLAKEHVKLTVQCD